MASFNPTVASNSSDDLQDHFKSVTAPPLASSNLCSLMPNTSRLKQLPLPPVTNRVVLQEIRINQYVELLRVTKRRRATTGFGASNSESLFGPTSRARNEFSSAIRTPKRHFSGACRAKRALETADHCISSIGERSVAALTYGSHLQHTTSPLLTRAHQ